MECLSVYKLALGACLIHNSSETCNLIQRKEMAAPHVHVCIKTKVINCMRVFLFFYGFVNIGGRGKADFVFYSNFYWNFFYAFEL